MNVELLRGKLAAVVLWAGLLFALSGLPGPAINEPIAISPDGRTIYYGAMRSQSDIWIVEPR